MGGERGFTLVEAVVAMTIFSFVAVLVAALYLHGYRSYSRESERIEVQENLRIAMARMTAKIRQADPDSMTISDSGRHIEFILSSSGKRAGYRLDALGNEIEEKIESSGGYTWLPVAGQITDLVFTREGNNITVTLVGGNGKSGKVRLSTKVNLRVGENG